MPKAANVIELLSKLLCDLSSVGHVEPCITGVMNLARSLGAENTDSPLALQNFFEEVNEDHCGPTGIIQASVKCAGSLVGVHPGPHLVLWSHDEWTKHINDKPVANVGMPHNVVKLTSGRYIVVVEKHGAIEICLADSGLICTPMSDTRRPQSARIETLVQVTESGTTVVTSGKALHPMLTGLDRQSLKARILADYPWPYLEGADAVWWREDSKCQLAERIFVVYQAMKPLMFGSGNGSKVWNSFAEAAEMMWKSDNQNDEHEDEDDSI